MICTNGHPVNEGMQFCGECGAGIAAETPSSEFPPPISPNPSASSYASIANVPKSNKNLLIACAAALVLVVGGVVIAGQISNSGKVTIRGIALLMSKDVGDVSGSWDDCAGTGGYDDFSEGQNVKIQDEKSEIIGAGSAQNLSDGLLSTLVEMNDDSGWYGDIESDSSPEKVIKETFVTGANAGMTCGLYFEIKANKSDFYEVEMGDRGELSYSHKELEEDGFVITLTLGDD